MTRTTRLSSIPNRASRCLVAIVCASLVTSGETVFLAQAPAQATPQAAAEEPKLPPEQLDALVAPVALYPDPLLGQVLVASTYPLEIIQLQQWLLKNKGLKDKALADAVAKQPWDPSIQSMAALPDVVKRLGDDIQWTTDLGNAFLAQQGDVMDAVQRMRKKAQGTGTLKTTEQQKVETKVVEEKTVIVVEQANPQVVYVPSYNPVVVYGPPVYAYPPIYYPPSTGAIVATAAISFGVGMMMGAAWGGGWGYGCGWGHNDINVNVNNNFNRNTNINRNTNVNRGGNNDLESQSSAPRRRSVFEPDDRQQVRGNGPRGLAPGRRRAAVQPRGRRRSRDPVGGGGSRGAASDRSGGRSASPSAASQSSRGGGAGGGADRAGSRDVGAGRSSGGSALGSSSGYSGSSARASSARGSSSAGSRGGSRSGGGGGRRR